MRCEQQMHSAAACTCGIRVAARDRRGRMGWHPARRPAKVTPTGGEISHFRTRCSRAQRPLAFLGARGPASSGSGSERQGMACRDWRGVAVERGIIGGPLGLGGIELGRSSVRRVLPDP